MAESGVRPEPIPPVYCKEPWMESEQSAKLRCVSENVEELLDRLEESERMGDEETLEELLI